VAETSSDIREEIEQEREDLGANLRQLENTLKRPLNVRGFVEERPMDALVIALGAGFFLSSLLGGKPKSQRAPEAREMNETFALTGTALLNLAQQQFQQVKSGVTNGD
jgi:hypothetical protein